MVDLDLGAHRLLDEGDDIGGGNPGCAETCSDIGGTKIGRLDIDQGADIALEGEIESGSGLGRLELVADLAGEISVGGLP